MLNVTNHYCISPATSKGGFGAIFEISNTRPIFIFIYTSLELGLFVYDLVL